MFKNMIVSKIMQAYQKINGRAIQDEEYKRYVLKNPRRAIYEATGFKVPPEWALSVVEDHGRLKIAIDDYRWLHQFGLSRQEIISRLGSIIK